MSYRTIKRLLGETSLERKCRLLFGGGLLVLISGSFYIYARQTTALVNQQNQTAARLLVAPIILEKHWKVSERGPEVPTDAVKAIGASQGKAPENGEPKIASFVEQMASELKPPDMKDSSWALYTSEENLQATATARPADKEGFNALQEIGTRGVPEVIYFAKDKKRRPEYHYYAAVYASETCLACHRERNKRPDLKAGDLLGVVKVSFPLDKTQRSLAWNNAVLLATAIVTAFWLTSQLPPAAFQ